MSAVSTAQHARQVLELMRADARARDLEEWDWAAKGYGQTLLRLVEVGGVVANWCAGSGSPWKWATKGYSHILYYAIEAHEV